MIAGDELIVAPVALNAIMARLALEAGFKAVYLSGGSLGWVKCVTEANLSLSEMIDTALEMRAACPLPVILDAGGGWGDPVHIHRTMALSQAAGIAAIEIEDQLLPRRVEHHVGVDHLVPTELVVDRIKEAVAARTDPDLVIIGRTNARRVYDLDEALRRAEALRNAGADMIFVHTRDAEEIRTVSERLGGPLMTFAPQDGFSARSGSPAPRWPRWAIALPPRRAAPSRRCTRRCASPTMPRRRHARSLPGQGRRGRHDEGGARHLRTAQAAGDRAPHHGRQSMIGEKCAAVFGSDHAPQ